MSRWTRSLGLVAVATATAALPIVAAESPVDAAPPKRGAAAPAPTASGKTFADAVPCTACHTTAGWRSKADGASADGFDHSRTGFPLTGHHAQAPCTRCHSSNHRVQRACVSCHEDAHRQRLSRACDGCHSAMGWKVTRPIEIHRMTRFPLTGMHTLADCSECHQRAAEHQWFGAPVACFACHEHDYKRADLRPVHTGSSTSAPFPRDCSMCHRAVAWVPAMFDARSVGSAASGLSVAPPDHDLRFPISFGVHRGATCADCHATLAVPRSVRCVGCHAHDPVLLARQHRVPVGDGASCLSCHPAGARR